MPRTSKNSKSQKRKSTKKRKSTSGTRRVKNNSSISAENKERYAILYDRCDKLVEKAKQLRKDNPKLFRKEKRNGLRALDLFCCSGGVSYGLWLAGFDVVGVDINEKHLKNHPKEKGMKVIHGNVLDYLNEDFIKDFDLIWASPPCQGFSGLGEANKQNFCENTTQKHKDYRNLFGTVQEFLENCGKPYILENVGGCKNYMKNPIIICGLDMKLLTFRDRYFQTNMPLKGSRTIEDHVGAHTGHKVISHMKLDGDVFSIVGHSGKRNFWNKKIGQEILGIHWNATSLAIRESIPPCYAKYLGVQAMKYIK